MKSSYLAFLCLCLLEWNAVSIKLSPQQQLSALQKEFYDDNTQGSKSNVPPITGNPTEQQNVQVSREEERTQTAFLPMSMNKIPPSDSNIKSVSGTTPSNNLHLETKVEQASSSDKNENIIGVIPGESDLVGNKEIMNELNQRRVEQGKSTLESSRESDINQINNGQQTLSNNSAKELKERRVEQPEANNKEEKEVKENANEDNKKEEEINGESKAQKETLDTEKAKTEEPKKTTLLENLLKPDLKENDLNGWIELDFEKYIKKKTKDILNYQEELLFQNKYLISLPVVTEEVFVDPSHQMNYSQSLSTIGTKELYSKQYPPEMLLMLSLNQEKGVLKHLIAPYIWGYQMIASCQGWNNILLYQGMALSHKENHFYDSLVSYYNNHKNIDVKRKADFNSLILREIPLRGPPSSRHFISILQWLRSLKARESRLLKQPLSQTGGQSITKTEDNNDNLDAQRETKEQTQTGVERIQKEEDALNNENATRVEIEKGNGYIDAYSETLPRDNVNKERHDLNEEEDSELNISKEESHLKPDYFQKKKSVLVTYERPYQFCINNCKSTVVPALILGKWVEVREGVTEVVRLFMENGKTVEDPNKRTIKTLLISLVFLETIKKTRGITKAEWEPILSSIRQSIALYQSSDEEKEKKRIAKSASSSNVTVIDDLETVSSKINNSLKYRLRFIGNYLMKRNIYWNHCLSLKKEFLDLIVRSMDSRVWKRLSLWMINVKLNEIWNGSNDSLLTQDSNEITNTKGDATKINTNNEEKRGSSTEGDVTNNNTDGENNQGSSSTTNPQDAITNISAPGKVVEIVSDVNNNDDRSFKIVLEMMTSLQESYLVLLIKDYESFPAAVMSWAQWVYQMKYFVLTNQKGYSTNILNTLNKIGVPHNVAIQNLISKKNVISDTTRQAEYNEMLNNFVRNWNLQTQRKHPRYNSKNNDQNQDHAITDTTTDTSGDNMIDNDDDNDKRIGSSSSLVQGNIAFDDEKAIILPYVTVEELSNNIERILSRSDINFIRLHSAHENFYGRWGFEDSLFLKMSQKLNTLLTTMRDMEEHKTKEYEYKNEEIIKFSLQYIIKLFFYYDFLTLLNYN